MQVTFTTHTKDEVIDITDTIEELLNKQSFQHGLCNIFIQHTTCCITISDLDTGTDKDILSALRHLLPQLHYLHQHDPSHAPDHILSSIIGPSLTLPLTNGRLQLGTWQRIVLIELDGPRERQVEITLLPQN